MKALLDRSTNPFFRHSSADFFLARRNGRCVGRIAAILNNNHNRFHGEKTAFFGFFESIDDRSVASALLDAAAQWGRERGMTEMRGPMNYSTNETVGLLVDGFDSDPFLLMPHNPDTMPECWRAPDFIRQWISMHGFCGRKRALIPKSFALGRESSAKRKSMSAP
jgi:hypothetical protein